MFYQSFQNIVKILFTGGRLSILDKNGRSAGTTLEGNGRQTLPENNLSLPPVSFN